LSGVGGFDVLSRVVQESPCHHDCTIGWKQLVDSTVLTQLSKPFTPTGFWQLVSGSRATTQAHGLQKPQGASLRLVAPSTRSSRATPVCGRSRAAPEPPIKSASMEKASARARPASRNSAKGERRHRISPRRHYLPAEFQSRSCAPSAQIESGSRSIQEGNVVGQ
jgi:hypothetical protein